MAPITPAEWSARPGAIADPGPVTSASASPDASATITLVFEPPPSTPTTRSVIRMPCPVAVCERRENADDHRDRSSDQNVPRPCNPACRCEYARHGRKQGKQRLGEYDERHHEDRNPHPEYRITLDCPSPQDSKKEPSEECPISERCNRERDNDDRRALLLVQKCGDEQADAPRQRKKPGQPKCSLLIVGFPGERKPDVMHRRRRE